MPKLRLSEKVGRPHEGVIFQTNRVLENNLGDLMLIKMR